MTKIDEQAKSSRIRELNDQARTTMVGTVVVLTRALHDLEPTQKAAVLTGVSSFSDFDAENDPYGEHDMGFFEIDGTAFFFAFSYYDPSLTHASEDPSDPDKTARVLTIGLATDY